MADRDVRLSICRYRKYYDIFHFEKSGKKWSETLEVKEVNSIFYRFLKAVKI